MLKILSGWVFHKLGLARTRAKCEFRKKEIKETVKGKTKELCLRSLCEMPLLSAWYFNVITAVRLGAKHVVVLSAQSITAGSFVNYSKPPTLPIPPSSLFLSHTLSFFLFHTCYLILVHLPCSFSHILCILSI